LRNNVTSGSKIPAISQYSYLQELSLNIVFDLGGVVFNWQPDAIIQSIFDDPETQNLIRKEVFDHSDWVELDRGTITFDQAIDRGVTRTGLRYQDIERLLKAVPHFLTPIEATIELIHDLSHTKNRLFVLSNMHLASFAYLEQRYKIWDMFDGIVISSRIQMVKPELQIYEYLLNRYQLEPAETRFHVPETSSCVIHIAQGIRSTPGLGAIHRKKSTISAAGFMSAIFGSGLKALAMISRSAGEAEASHSCPGG
jgi:putative hydrolase of the HAD superfamily